MKRSTFLGTIAGAFAGFGALFGKKEDQTPKKLFAQPDEHDVI